MNNVWIVLGICIIVLLGSALPLITRRDDTPPPAPKKTPRDWRKEK